METESVEMRPGAKLAAFAAALVVSFAAGWGVGAALDPVIEPAPAPHEGHQP